MGVRRHSKARNSQQVFQRLRLTRGWIVQAHMCGFQARIENELGYVKTARRILFTSDDKGWTRPSCLRLKQRKQSGWENEEDKQWDTVSCRGKRPAHTIHGANLRQEKRYIKSVIHPRTGSCTSAAKNDVAQAKPGFAEPAQPDTTIYHPASRDRLRDLALREKRDPRSGSPKHHRSEEVVDYRVQSTPNRKILSKFDLICSSSSAICRRFSHHGYIFVSRSRRLHPLRTSTWMATSRGVMIWLLCSVHMLIATHCNIREPSYTRTDYDRKFGGRLFLFSPGVES